jgi:hypothetical protein
MNKIVKCAAFALVALMSSAAAVAGESYKPFVLAYRASGNVEGVAADVRNKLTAGGFEVVGTYSPYATTQLIIVTDGDLKQNAAQSKFGGYGIAQRVAVSKVGEEIQVSYTNPVYMAAAYRMAGDLKGVAEHLAKVLGRSEEFGPEAGLEASKLRKYHYMFGMEYFDDPSVLAEYDSYEAAVKAVEQGLAKNTVGASKVYRVDVPGKQETVFGVGLRSERNKYQDDAYVMSEIDFKPTRSSAHLPYEMLVSGNKVYALYARFRIAINFPDLSMMGDHSFMNIMATPDAIKNALTVAAGGKVKGPLD